MVVVVGVWIVLSLFLSVLLLVSVGFLVSFFRFVLGGLLWKLFKVSCYLSLVFSVGLVVVVVFSLFKLVSVLVRLLVLVFSFVVVSVVWLGVSSWYEFSCVFKVLVGW